MHFGALKVFVTAIQRANPIWLAAAVMCQIATYACGHDLVARSKARRIGRAICRFAQARVCRALRQSGGPDRRLSGSLMVMHGLTRRGVDPATAITALLIAALSFYVAYFCRACSCSLPQSRRSRRCRLVWAPLKAVAQVCFTSWVGDWKPVSLQH